jgi:hypothetical protein
MARSSSTRKLSANLETLEQDKIAHIVDSIATQITRALLSAEQEYQRPVREP